MSVMQTAIVDGFGRYGGGLAGGKYVKGEFKAKLVGIIDPRIDEIRRSIPYSIKGIPTYHSIEEVPIECLKQSVVDIALIPQIVLESFKKLVERGVKKFILPKPVTTNQRDFNEMLDLTEGAKLKPLVASNWHYADITKLTKALLDKLTGKTVETQSDLPKDFAAKFTPTGECVKTQSINYESQNSPDANWSYEICEDNINSMYSSMFDAFVTNTNDALTLNQYQPIASMLYRTEDIWNKCKR